MASILAAARNMILTAAALADVCQIARRLKSDVLAMRRPSRAGCAVIHLDFIQAAKTSLKTPNLRWKARICSCAPLTAMSLWAEMTARPISLVSARRHCLLWAHQTRPSIIQAMTASKPSMMPRALARKSLTRRRVFWVTKSGSAFNSARPMRWTVMFAVWIIATARILTASPSPKLKILWRSAWRSTVRSKMVLA